MRIALPLQPTFDPFSLRNLQVRVGNTWPGKVRNQVITANTLCANLPGRFAKHRGQVLTVQCKGGPIKGKYLSVQIV